MPTDTDAALAALGRALFGPALVDAIRDAVSGFLASGVVIHVSAPPAVAAPQAAARPVADRKPADKGAVGPKPAGSGRFRWTQAADDVLRADWPAGVSQDVIEAKVFRIAGVALAPRAVSMRVARLGLSRPPHMRRGRTAHVARRRGKEIAQEQPSDHVTSAQDADVIDTTTDRPGGGGAGSGDGRPDPQPADLPAPAMAPPPSPSAAPAMTAAEAPAQGKHHQGGGDEVEAAEYADSTAQDQAATLHAPVPQAASFVAPALTIPPAADPPAPQAAEPPPPPRAPTVSPTMRAFQAALAETAAPQRPQPAGSMTPRRATADQVRAWAAERGLPFTGPYDLPKVNAKRSQLGLPVFDLVVPPRPSRAA